MELKLPVLGENVAEGDIVRVCVAAGDVIQKDQTVIEIETDKAVVEVPAEQGGKVTEILAKAGTRIKVGEVILKLEAANLPAATLASAKSAQTTQNSAGAQALPTQVAAVKSGESRQGASSMYSDSMRSETQVPGARQLDRGVEPVRAAPQIRRMAREQGIDLNQVTPSGERGRITKEDLLAPLPGGSGVQVAASRREPLSKVRRITAAHMAHSWTTIPHVTQFDQADITSLLEVRKQLASKVEAGGGKLTVTAMIAKVVALGLTRFEKFNAQLDMEREEVVYSGSVHLGVAVDTPRGLLVPVIRDAQAKTLTDIARELGEAADRARASKSRPDELKGSTFTISNLGGLGTTFFTPIVNSPEVAILGVGRALVQPAWIDNSWQPRSILPLSLSYDHRLIDGADTARFLRWIAQALEDPWSAWV